MNTDGSVKINLMFISEPRIKRTNYFTSNYPEFPHLELEKRDCFKCSDWSRCLNKLMEVSNEALISPHVGGYLLNQWRCGKHRRPLLQLESIMSLLEDAERRWGCVGGVGIGSATDVFFVFCFFVLGARRRGQGCHCSPVVSSFRAFCRFWMAVPTSSYCRALPAYLQYFWAFVKSSGVRCTPPREGGEEGADQWLDEAADIRTKSWTDESLLTHHQWHHQFTNDISDVISDITGLKPEQMFLGWVWPGMIHESISIHSFNQYINSRFTYC